MPPSEPYNPSFVHWFGDPWPSEAWRAPICEDDQYRIDVPVGAQCINCGELIDEDDRGVRLSGSVVMGDDGKPKAGPTPYAHIECNLRSVMGCYAHLVKAGHDHERPYREDARLVWAWFQRRDNDR